jgi:uncharacterized caspase-like protein
MAVSSNNNSSGSSNRRFALIVANSDYQDSDLRKLISPSQDAETLSNVLRDPSIGRFDEVKVLLNEPSHKVNRELQTFFTGRKRDDLLLLYFSCHGVKDINGRLYFASTDPDRKVLRASAISADFVKNEMFYSNSKRQVLLLDCCYSGAFVKGMLSRSDKKVHDTELFKGRGRIVITASNSMQYAFDGDSIREEGSVYSYFTDALVHGLKTGQADVDNDGN